MAARFRFLYAFLFLFLISCAENRIVREHSGFVPQPEKLSPSEQNVLAQYFAREKATQLDQLLERYNRYYGFHGNVLIASKGNILYESGIGYAELREKTPLTTDAVFQLASISKQFTALAVCMLLEERKLDYNDQLTKFYPQLPYQNVTIRHLLNHTSGLPNYMWLVENSWKQERAPYNDEVINLMATTPMGVYFRPGRRFDYSNTGYMLLAAIVEKVSGVSFHDYVEERIFKPLDMESSFVYSSAREYNYGCRLGGFTRYRWGFRSVQEDIHNGTVGDKGIYSTIEDLYKWDQALYSEKIVSSATLQKAFTPGTLNNRRNIPYGFGFRLSERDDKKVVYHNGLWHGFRTSFMRYVEDSATIIVLSHSNCEGKNNLVRQIETVLFQQEQFNPAKVLAEVALYQGVQQAVEHYHKMAGAGELANLQPFQLSEIAEILEQMNKPILSSRLQQLKQELHQLASMQSSPDAQG
ncbi:MAG: serine hydrolase domain-containing protein [Bacteroidia bacterium]